MYKIIIPDLTSDGLKQRALHLPFTTRNEASKIVWLKLGHCLLNYYHKSKFDTDTKPNCQEWNSKETPFFSVYLLFDCNKSENERQKLKKAIKSMLNKNKISWHSIRAEELLGKPEDAKKVRLEVLKFFSNTEKDI